MTRQLRRQRAQADRYSRDGVQIEREGPRQTWLDKTFVYAVAYTPGEGPPPLWRRMRIGIDIQPAQKT